MEHNLDFMEIKHERGMFRVLHCYFKNATWCLMSLVGSNLTPSGSIDVIEISPLTTQLLLK
jgi:hypothetical protein